MQSHVYTIRFTFCNNRLYVTMDVLNALGRPDHIQVFISRDRKTLFIRSCNRGEDACFAVSPRVYTDPEYKCILRKAAFAEAICHVQHWDRRGRYRLYGVPVAEQVMAFSFVDAVRIDETSSEAL